MNRPKAYSYVRMSSAIQLKGDSMRRQLEASEQYCAQNNLELVERLEDVGIPAFKGENLEFGTLGHFVDLVKQRRIEPGSYLIIESLDRLSRQAVTTAFRLFADILDAGIIIATLADGQTYTRDSLNEDAGRIFVSLGAMLRAHDESRTKSVRLKAAWSKKRKTAGEKILTAKAPGWLKLSDDRTEFEVLPEAANAVRNIFQWAVNGDGYFVITRRLNASRVPPIGRSPYWNSSYVKKILSSREVLGEFQPHRVEGSRRVPDGEPLAGYFPQIVEADLFILARRQIESRKSAGGGRRGRKVSNLFQHIAKCGSCGAPMNFINKGSKPQGSSYLVCRSALQGQGCTTKPWRYEEFENAVLEFISELSLEEIFDNEKEQAKLALESDLARMESEADSARQRLNANVSRWMTADPSLQVILEEALLEERRKLDDLDVQISAMRHDILRANEGAAENAKSNVETYKAKISEAKNDDEVAMLRSQIASQIRSLITRISVFTPVPPEPWEIHTDADPDGNPHTELLRFLSQFGVSNEQDAMGFLGSTKGKAVARDFERHFVVRFVTGSSKLVRPAMRQVQGFQRPHFRHHQFPNS